jgi:nucleotide-sensitive chloride channel 1A
MGVEARLIQEPPNTENTIHVDLYRASSPEKFSLEDDDKFVLHGGGSNYSIKFLDTPGQDLHLDPAVATADCDHVSVYVLNTSLILWFDNNSIGIEIPYQLISLHAIKPTTEQEPLCKLYLQLLPNEVIRSVPRTPCEFTATTEVEVVVNGDGTTLPLVRQGSSIDQLYQALCTCSALHYDTENSDDNDEFFPGMTAHEPVPALQIPSNWVTSDGGGFVTPDGDDFVLANTGHADDLEFDGDNEENDNYRAAMPVDVGYASIAGSIRKRESETTVVAKNRRMV